MAVWHAAGHYVPTLAAALVSLELSGQAVANLAGFVIGNPWTDPAKDNLGTLPDCPSAFLCPRTLPLT